MDRNSVPNRLKVTETESLSARRAWIEIKALQVFFMPEEVALRKESVDRNVNSRLHSLLV